jgi:hypothetical protein
LALDVAQTQKPEWGTYRIQGLEVWLDGKPFRIDVDGRQTRQVIEGVPQKPRKVEVDPGGWWLLKTSSIREN